MTAIVTIIVFLVVVLIHELGHFITAKMSGVHVIEFAVGMGPKLISKQYKDTLYSIRILPLGGFCMMEGEDEDEYSSKSINAQPAWKRFIVLAAGSFNNIVLAFVLFSILFFKMGFISNEIESIVDNKPAYKAGIIAGDEIYSINNININTWNDVGEIIEKNQDNTASVKIIRDGEYKELELKPYYDDEYSKWMIGIQPKIDHSVGIAVKQSLGHMKFIVTETFKLLGRLFKFEDVSKEVSGPVGIIKMVNQATQYGFYAVLEIAALISMSLGIFNLLPFPALDGGRIVFVLIEKIIRRPVNKEIEGYFHLAGFGLLIIMTILITIKDLSK